MPQGKAIIFAAPSGSGKTTIVRRLVSEYPQLGFSISACTRDKRGRSEVHGKDYYFLSKDEFRKKIEEDDFVEWEEVYEGNYYGTLKSEIQRIWDEGKHVIFDVDVKGALNLKKYFGDRGLAVFVKVPSLDELKSRLTDRGTEDPESISRRLYKAEFEMGFADKFDVVLLNDNLEMAVSQAKKLVGEFIAQ